MLRIFEDTRAGRLVIFDQALGNPKMNEQAAARIMQRIFSSQQQAFTNPETDEKTGEILGDSIKKLPQLARSIQKCQQSQVKLLITSPPYSNVTNYYYDQWLRLWLLGGPEYPGKHGDLYGGKFSNSERYYQLLNRVFARAKRILANDAIIYIRTDRREPTLHTTRSVLKETFPEKHIIDEIEQPLNPARQTRPYSRGGAPKKANCEVDIILEPR